MANTYTLIASNTVGSGGSATISFTSIPATYTDLCLQLSIRTADTGLVYDGIKVTFNGSSSGYSDRMVYGDGSSATSANTSGSSTRFHYATTNLATSSTFCNTFLYITNYAGSNYKSISSDSVTENNGTAVITVLNAALWSNTAAITSVSLTSNSGANFTQYSTAYLYGISNS
jgi:hypothetical protein